jgi:hypothetical protein
MKSRTFIHYPKTPESWNDLPKEFLDYLDYLDDERVKLTHQNSKDPLYPTYNYEWDIDDELSLMTIIPYWNKLDDELPEANIILKEIDDCVAETSYDNYISSFYSY